MRVLVISNRYYEHTKSKSGQTPPSPSTATMVNYRAVLLSNKKKTPNYRTVQRLQKNTFASSRSRHLSLSLNLPFALVQYVSCIALCFSESFVSDFVFVWLYAVFLYTYTHEHTHTHLHHVAIDYFRLIFVGTVLDSVVSIAVAAH